MAAGDLELAERFRDALEAAAQTNDHEAVYALLAPDVEWVTPQRTLRGVDDMRANWSWGSKPESFDYEFEEGDWAELGDGRLACEVRQVYLLKESGDFAYERKRRVVVTIRDGMISRYELIISG